MIGCCTRASVIQDKAKEYRAAFKEAIKNKKGSKTDMLSLEKIEEWKKNPKEAEVCCATLSPYDYCTVAPAVCAWPSAAHAVLPTWLVT